MATEAAAATRAAAAVATEAAAGAAEGTRAAAEDTAEVAAVAAAAATREVEVGTRPPYLLPLPLLSKTSNVPLYIFLCLRVLFLNTWHIKSLEPILHPLLLCVLVTLSVLPVCSPL